MRIAVVLLALSLAGCATASRGAAPAQLAICERALDLGDSVVYSARPDSTTIARWHSADHACKAATDSAPATHAELSAVKTSLSVLTVLVLLVYHPWHR